GAGNSVGGGAAAAAPSGLSNTGMSGSTPGLGTGTGLGTSAGLGSSAASSNQPSTGGQIQADPSTNSLIITAPEPLYRQLRAVIDKLDGRRAQVLVESLIVEVNADKAAEFGIQWQTALGQRGDTNIGVIGTNYSANAGSGSNIINLAIGGATGNVRPGTGLNFGIGHKIDGQYVLGFLARFLETNGDGNVLSTPNLLTLDNEEARIVIGQNVPFVTGQYTNNNSNNGAVNPFQTIERKDVGLSLRVRPQINENGTVKLSIFQEVSDVLPSTLNNPNGPTTSKRSIESNVLVEDGAIVVLGGLLQDKYSGTREKVPGLGDVPVLGNLFRSETRSRNKTNLMVFLRPVVVRDAATSDALSMDRYEMIRGLQNGAQPDPNLMLRAVPQGPALPPAPPAARPGEGQPQQSLQPQPQSPTPAAAAAPLSAAPAVAPVAATPAAVPPPVAAQTAQSPVAQAPAAPETAAAAGYYVNVGLFPTDRNGQAVVTRLRKAALPVKAQEVSTTRGERLRVRVGPYESLRSADAAAATVRRLSYDAVVQRQTL
ncbi:MAG: type II secretion system secretin GspD, partial [Burkholderiaceae bacterium]